MSIHITTGQAVVIVAIAVMVLLGVGVVGTSIGYTFGEMKANLACAKSILEHR